MKNKFLVRFSFHFLLVVPLIFTSCEGSKNIDKVAVVELTAVMDTLNKENLILLLHPLIILLSGIIITLL